MSASVSGRRGLWRAASNCLRATWPVPPPPSPPVSCCQISIMVRPPWVSSSSLLVAQPQSVAVAAASRRPRVRSVKFQCMAFSNTVIDLAALGVVVDGKGVVEVDGDLGAGLHVDGCKGLAVELVNPLGHVAHATGQDAAHGLVARDAHAADGAVRPHIGHAPAVALDERSHARARRRDQGLGAQVLLRVAAALAADAGNPMGIADPAQAIALLSVLLVAFPILGDGADRAVLEDVGDAAHLAAHARERPVA